jgi:RNA polymerase primary sigma factor
VRAALRHLTPRERQVLRLRFGIGRCMEHTLEEIGRELGLTRQRILQIVNKALEKIRTSRHGRTLRSYVDA